MNRATPALLAFLLAFSLVAVPAAAGPVDETRNVRQAALQERTETNDAAAAETSNRLSLEGESRHAYTEYGADLGMLLASTDDALRTDHAQYTLLDHGFETASNDEREAMVQDAYDRLKERIAELEERERDAVDRHMTEELSTTQFLQQVLRNHYEARILSEAANDIQEHADRVEDYSLSVQDEQNQLEMHRTPVRTHLDRAARGKTIENVVVAVETAETGYSISYLGGDYVREATRFDNRESASWPSEFEDASDAYDHTSELYPWVFENRHSAGAREDQTVNLYRIYATHDQGRFEAYLDGGSGEVHREVQVLSPTSLPTETETIWSNDDLELSLNETPSNGPAKVVVTDVETGESETATISVDGFEVGETDSDGTLWFAPPAEEYTLTAETNASSIEVTVSNG